MQSKPRFLTLQLGGFALAGLYGVIALLVAVLALSATALIAAWIPAHRAARVEPVRALRYE